MNFNFSHLILILQVIGVTTGFHIRSVCGNKEPHVVTHVQQRYKMFKIPSHPVGEAEESYSPIDTFLEQLNDQFEENPDDSVTITELKALINSILKFCFLFMGIFSASYFAFPGNFRSMPHLSMPTQSELLGAMIEPEFSESGGVYFSESDVPLAKSSVTVSDWHPRYIKTELAPYLGELEDI